MWPAGAFEPSLPPQSDETHSGKPISPSACVLLSLACAFVKQLTLVSLSATLLPPALPLLPYHPPTPPPTHTAATIREALDWWAKPPLSMTSPMGKAGESGESGGRGGLKKWLHTVALFPQWLTDGQNEIQIGPAVRLCPQRKVRREVKQVEQVTAAPGWPHLAPWLHQLHFTSCFHSQAFCGALKEVSKLSESLLFLLCMTTLKRCPPDWKLNKTKQLGY